MPHPPLPVFAIQEALDRAVLEHGCAVISAPTGSGKSTWVPRMVLPHVPDGKRVLVLQPRRLAARMLAERVAAEWGCAPGEEIGYQTRFEKAVSAKSRIVYITEGIFTRLLLTNPALDGVGAVLFDEFHERNLHSDLGLAMAKVLKATKRPDLQILVMSATLDAEALSAYLNGCPILRTEGRLYPVEIGYRPVPQGKTLFAAATAALRSILCADVPGDVLVFMPGGYEIRATAEEFRHLSTSEKLDILMLYGEMPPEEQRKVMDPSANRKVIIATNIAETSLTIPGIRHVIDSGLARVNHYDAFRGVNSLETRPIARDSADQRAGRAGREAPGSCQRLWSGLEQQSRPPHSIPEIQRIDLAEALLTLSCLGYNDPAAFPWLEPPPPAPLAAAGKLLRQLGILQSEDGRVTELGRTLSAMPAHPRLALLIWLGSRDGCFTKAALAAGLLNERPLMTASTADRATMKQGRNDARQSHRHANAPESDFLSAIALLQEARDARFDLECCRRMGIHAGAARDIWNDVSTYREQARRLGWNTKDQSDDTIPFLKTLLMAFPDRLARRKDQSSLACLLSEGRHGELDRNSVVRDENLFITVEIREVAGTGRQTSRLLLSLASGVQEEWLWELFPNQWQDLDETLWDEKRQLVTRKRTLSCLDLPLEEKTGQDVAPEKAAQILAQRIADGHLNLPNWDNTVEQWISRVRWLAAACPDHPLPSYDEADRMKVYLALCQGETTYRGVKAKNCLDAARGLLTHGDQRFVDTMAPPWILLPNGRRMKIEYTPGLPPKGRARIQDLYDVKQRLTVANGRVPVLMDILAPNQRTVQITDDLPRFWEVHYPKLRSELSRRYPKHKWL